MTKLILERWRDRYDEIVIVFANTGQEREEALAFVHRCDIAFGWGVVWVEAVVDPEPGEGTKHRVVDFATADRCGAAFEGMIAKFGIPGPGFFHCTRELKVRPITSYVRSIGWAAGTYDTAIGFRIDGTHRVKSDADKVREVYPLAQDWPHTKPHVNDAWFKMPFRLELKGYQGNCKWCWKKSLRKHLTIMRETPDDFDFPERMETTYPMAGANPRNEEKRFFRDRKTVADIRRLAAEPFEPAHDDAREYQTDLLHGFDLDAGSGCAESCEVQFEDAA